jgi:hypothetical protein
MGDGHETVERNRGVGFEEHASRCAPRFFGKLFIGLASDLVRLDEFLDVARDKSDEFPESHEWDCPCFDAVI